MLHDHLGDKNQFPSFLQHHLLHLHLWSDDQRRLHGVCRSGKVSFNTDASHTVSHTVSDDMHIIFNRYLIIAWPLWYRFKRTIKVSVVVCILVWSICLVIILIVSLESAYFYPFILLTIFLLLPFPLLVFSLVGTLKALSASISVQTEEKRHIVGILVLVLLNYTLMFLPTILLSYCRDASFLHGVSFTLIQLNPLADLVLYVFMRRGTMDKFSLCCKTIVVRSSREGRFSTPSRQIKNRDVEVDLTGQ